MKQLTPRWIALVTITAITLYVTWLIFQPFINVVLWSIVLTVIASPLYEFISRYQRSANISAALTLAIVLILGIIPITFVVYAVVSRLEEGVATVHSVAAWLLDPGSAHAKWLAQYVDVEMIFRRENVQEIVKRVGSYIAQVSPDVVGYTVVTVMQFLLVLFTTYYMLRDGRKLLVAARDLLPLKQHQADHLFNNIRTIISASLRGTVLIAAIQGALGGLAFWVLGLPAPALWGVVMFFMSMVPVVGSSVIWLPATIYLVSDSGVKALLLFIWGAGVIAAVDNVLRPVLVGSKTRMHELTVFFSVLGGLKLFGPVGIIMGPIVVAVAMGLMRIFEENAIEPESGEMKAVTATFPAVATEPATDAPVTEPPKPDEASPPAPPAGA